MNVLIINNGFLGDSIFAGSLGENCKRNGYDRVDLVIGFPQTLDILKCNPYLDNVYLATRVGAHITPDTLPKEINLSIYDKIYVTPGAQFNEKFLDTFNKELGLNLTNIKHDFKLYLPEMEFNWENNSKPKLAFQKDWYARSFSKNNLPRNTNYIIDSISKKYDVFIIGETTHFNINEDTSYNFMVECGLIGQCDLFFGFPGGMHWVAAGVNTTTITTSEHMFNHYTNTGEFKGNTFEEFNDSWMLQANKHFNNTHILLELEISDDDIISYLLNYNINEFKTIN